MFIKRKVYQICNWNMMEDVEKHTNIFFCAVPHHYMNSIYTIRICYIKSDITCQSILLWITNLLEPYVLKGTRTVLRRGRESNLSNLSDFFLRKTNLSFFKQLFFQNLFFQIIY
jgi:hypothetical protein